MEHLSRVDDTPESRRLLEDQLRECYGRASYSHKTHEKCADILLAKLASIKFWQIVLSAITTGGFIFAIIDSARLLGVIGTVISTTLLVLNSYAKDYNLGSSAERHKQTANDIWLVRERYLDLITDLLMNRSPIEPILEQRDRLATELHAIYAGAPSTNAAAYKKAQEALKVREDMTFSDSELDSLLPTALRKASR